MIFFHSNGGQLCNRIWSYLLLIAHSIHFNEHIFILDFNEYLSLFPNLSTFPNVHFVESKKLKSIIRIITKIFKTAINNKDIDIYKRCFFFSGEGWKYRSETLYLRKYKKKLLQLFAPQESVIKKCESFLLPLKRDRIIVGVHIRRKDYCSFYDGAYYFENDVYKHYMEKVHTELSIKFDKEINYLICTDEDINLNDFKPFNCMQISNGSNMHDLYGLSLCDYIIGPPSTFSMWASFYGNVPIKIINNPGLNFSIDQCKIITAVDRFNDGSIFTHRIIQ